MAWLGWSPSPVVVVVVQWLLHRPLGTKHCGRRTVVSLVRVQGRVQGPVGGWVLAVPREVLHSHLLLQAPPPLLPPGPPVCWGRLEAHLGLHLLLVVVMMVVIIVAVMMTPTAVGSPLSWPTGGMSRSRA